MGSTAEATKDAAAATSVVRAASVRTVASVDLEAMMTFARLHALSKVL